MHQTMDNSAILSYLDDKAETVNVAIGGQLVSLERLADVKTEESREERATLMTNLRHLVLEHEVLTHSKRSLVQEIEDELTVNERTTTTAKDDAKERIAKAYAQSLLPSVCDVAGPKMKKSERKIEKEYEKLKQSAFRKRVLGYYEGMQEIDIVPELLKWMFCQVTGRYHDRSNIRAADIVPKSISDRTMEHLFGSDEQKVRESPRNALLLHENLEKALNNGDIAIVPIKHDPREPSRWKIILLDPTLTDKAVYYEVSYSGRILSTYWRELVDKELSFRNEHRPAKRYLYLRFIVALLKAEKKGRRERVLEALNDPSTDLTIWPSAGEYIRRRSLTAITRTISGLNLRLR